MTTLPTVDVAARVQAEPPGLDDAAEAFHEACRLAPSTIAAQLVGSIRLAADPLLQASAQRASRRHPHRPGVALAPVRLPPVLLAEALARRSSILHPGRLQLDALAGILEAAYGCRPRDAVLRRPVPSAGALYPLEVYAISRAVDGLSAGVHHFDPYSHRLESLDAADPTDSLAAALFDSELVTLSAAALAVTAVFQRTRFKYGQRGHRFALLEAGHLAQNVLLAAAGLKVSALPYGGFYDRRIDALLQVDGLNESAVHLILLGGEAP